MSTTVTTPRASRALAPETISQSFAVLFIVTLLQRGLGFVRGTLFANLMSPAELGLWDMTYGFVMLASPLVMLGLPACFARYVARYRQQGQLTSFVKRTLRVCVTAGLGVALLAGLADRPLAAVIYGDERLAPLGRLAALCLAAIVLFNILQALFQGLRLFRIVSLMYLGHVAGFTVLGTLLLLAGDATAPWAAVGYMATTFAVVLAVGLVVKRCVPPDAVDAQVEPARRFWKKMATYAFWIWAANSLLGLFQYVDRLMLVHFSGQTHTTVLEQLGTYHVLRLVALVVFSLAGVASSVMVPHLGHHWEAGRRSQVTVMLGTTVKAAAFGLLGASVILLCLEGFLLGVVFGGKFSGGSSVMPAALTFSVVAGLYSLADPYLLCLEKVWLSAIARFAALAANVALNAVLIPIYYLNGAATATALAMAVGLGVLLTVCRRQGWRFDRGLAALAAMPLTLLAGPAPAAVVLLVALWTTSRYGWFFNAAERAILAENWRAIARRLRSATAPR